MERLDTFGKRLEWAMKVRRIGKMYTLASAMGVDESAISRWRRSKPISNSNLVKLCSTLEISADWLLAGIGDMNRPSPSHLRGWERDFAQEMRALGIVDPTAVVRMFEKLASAAASIPRL